MSKCLKCNIDYDDSFDFCPNCGERLVKQNKCPKCGEPITDSDKFCHHCGNKIVRVRYCSKCNETFDEKVKFCPNCGSPTESVVSSTVVEDKTSPKVKEEKVEEEKPISTFKRSKTLTMIIGSIFIIAALLFVVGVFGSFVHLNSSGFVKDMDFTYYFSEGYKDLNSIKDSYINNDYYSLNVIMFVFENIIIFGGMIVGIVYAVLGSIDTIKKMSYNGDISGKKFIVSGIASFGISVFYLSRVGVDVNYPAESKICYGWGSILIIVGMSLTFLADVILRIYRANMLKKNSVSTSTFQLSKIFLFVTVLLGFTYICNVSFSMSGIYLIESPYALLAAGTQLYSSTGEYHSMFMTPTIVAFVFQMFGLFAGAASLLLYDKENKIPSFSLALASLLSMVATLIASFYSAKYYIIDTISEHVYNTYVTVHANGTVIVGLIFGSIAVLGMAIADTLKKRKY